MIKTVRPKKPDKIIFDMPDDEIVGWIRKVSDGSRLSREEYDRKRPRLSPCSKTILRRTRKTWTVLCDEIWGKSKDPPVKVPDVDEIYIIKVALEFGIKTESAWRSKRKEHPQIIPSHYYVRKMFGSFPALMKVAERYDIKRNLLRCLEVKIKIGRSPTMKDYEDFGVNVRYLKKKFINLSEINRKVRMLEEGFNEISKRDKEEGGGSRLKDVQREAERAFEPFSAQLRS